MKSDNDLSNKYQKKSDKQHILDNPDTYIGSIENIILIIIFTIIVIIKLLKKK